MYILSISVLLYAFLLSAHAIDRPHSPISHEGSAYLRRHDSTGEADTTNSAATSAIKHVLVGASNKLAVYGFNGTAFKVKTTNNSYKGRASWLTFKEPNLLYVNQEDGLHVRLFHYAPLTGDLSPQIEEFAAPLGVRHLAWNANKTVLIGSAYDQGCLIVWDATDPQGKLATINIYGLGEGVHQPHQAVLDPTGQFFVVNDSGGDQLVILNNEMKYGIWDHIPVTPAGSAPKHGVFLIFEADKINGIPGATYYVVTCSNARTVQLFKVDYPTSTTISFKDIQTISSSGPFPPLNQGTAEASDIVLYGKSSLVVTNSFTGNTSDYLSFFELERAEDGNNARLVFQTSISSLGLSLCHVSLSKDWSTYFIANQMGQFGLGTLSANAAASISNVDFNADTQGNMTTGPLFVAEF